MNDLNDGRTDGLTDWPMDSLIGWLINLSTESRDGKVVLTANAVKYKQKE